MSSKQLLRSLALVACVSGVALAPFAEAEAALNAYLRMKGQKVGDIKGSVVKKGRENMIAILSLDHEVSMPRDAASGLATGRRQHKPLVLTMELGKATPTIQQAFLDNELLTSVELNVFGPDAKGAETLTYTVKLTNASIAAIRLLPGPNDQVVQEVSLTYQKIEWIWRDGNVTASDDWEKHNVKR
ncbi:type VI secretion system tube protein TssD [Nannocystis bainbridge]|uniref:Type VI secretion system tube protein TssD n=1 Tax=Nannocystis bainbridge TaxID=2995303 RepID=A0ABT5DZB9_9BACT|nr:type VI secretion system tube protein TssD [Nannocystis bainbridge]MDC0718404.1 type VI secretion system tube protein TssD [Nannocystis bainbridge]